MRLARASDTVVSSLLKGQVLLLKLSPRLITHWGPSQKPGHAPTDALHSFLAWYQWCIAAPRKNEKSTTRRRHRNSDTDSCSMLLAQWLLISSARPSQNTATFESIDLPLQSDIYHKRCRAGTSSTSTSLQVCNKLSGHDTKICEQTTDLHPSSLNIAQ